jgi:signal transduction histidine kinase
VTRDEPHPRANARWKLFLIFNAAFWCAAFLLFAAQAGLLGSDEQWNLSLRRAVLVTWGFTLTTLAHAAFEWAATQFSDRVRWSLLTTPILAAVCTCGFYVVYHVWRPAPGLEPFPLEGVGGLWPYLVANYPFHLFLWAGWVGLYLAFHYAQTIAARDRELVVVAAQAQRAELLMLRYQINPHFLFNTLNAISAQIMTGHTREADDMLTALSRFLRHSLAHSDLGNVRLGDELATQELYLSIEQVRFRERLVVKTQIEPMLEDALVPGFVLQPLIENAMKHAVMASSRPVTVTVSAARNGDGLRIRVEDDGPGAANSNALGLGTGLANIRARLEALYGDQAAVHVSTRPSGGFSVEMLLPLELAALEQAA